MPDPRFYNVNGPFTLEELAQLPDIVLAPGVDATIEIRDVQPLDR
ncbi:MAG: UDP-3-O-(3-hydroxymyristoyl)glucosamine N-acyltransferase, partial [Alphaproteobacteria bacterium]